MRDLVDIAGDAESWTGRECAARPHAELLAELRDSRTPKTEREHAAVREIGLLEDALKLYRAERLEQALRKLEEREQRDEALLRQALEALGFFRDTAICEADTAVATEAIAALRERLGEKA